ncbi:MAG: dienelactone hydrolase family protein, partial [Gammaproteobacteria bacterium]
LERAQALRARFDVARGVADIAATIATLRDHPAQIGKVAAVGFCLGGLLATLTAADGAVDCAVSYYGTGLETQRAAIDAVRCPMVFHCGDSDAKVPAAARDMLAQASAAHPHLHTFLYPGCGHAFANPARESYDKPATMMAYSRTMALLREVMGPVYDLSTLWDAHTAHEFATRDVDATMATMVAEPYVNHIPTMTGGVGHDHLKRFYKYHFVNSNPPDTRLIPVSRTVGADRLVDEMVFCFTHTCEIPWMLPGIAPTGRYVEIPLVAIVNFRGDKLYHEHIYWDQASVLVQVGLLDPAGLPVAGSETAKKLIDESLPSNTLMGATWAASAGKPL